MSTSYRIATKGARLSLRRIKAIAAHHGWFVQDSPVDEPAKVQTLLTDGGYLHLFRTGKTAWNEFERFGLNDPTPWIEALEEEGYTILSEHDEGF